MADIVAALKGAAAAARAAGLQGRGGRWVDVRSDDINEYLKDATGDDVSAKDFRTWNATVLAAVALAVAARPPATKTGRKRAITRAVKEVAYYLGNTPAVARASYIDPRVFDRYRDGDTIAAVPRSAAPRRATTARHPGPGRGSASSTSSTDREPGQAGGFVGVERLDGLVARRADREDLVEPVISNVLAMFGSVLTIVSTPSRERSRLTAPMRTPSAVESRNDVFVRSTTIRVWPDSSASPSADLSSGAVKRSISPDTATTWRWSSIDSVVSENSVASNP